MAPPTPLLSLLVGSALLATAQAGDPAVGYGSDFVSKCAKGREVLGVFLAGDNQFAASCTEPQVCNQYFPPCNPGGACGAPFSYVYEAKETGGKPYKSSEKRAKRGVFGRISQKCCVIQPPPGEDISEICEVFPITHTDSREVDLFNAGGFGAVGGPSTRYVKYIAKIPTGYSVTICYLQCSDTTTTRRPTTELPELEEDILGEDFLDNVVNDPPAEPANLGGDGGGGSCFPEDGMVTTPDGPRRMDQLKAGDAVLTHSDTFSGHSFEPVLFFLHREPETEAQFVELQTHEGLKVQMTADHMVPVLDCDEEATPPGNGHLGTHMKPARQVAVGSCLLSGQPGSSRLQRVTAVASPPARRGIYNPVTASGTIVVNGLHCGTYLDTPRAGSGMAHFLTHSVVKWVWALERLTGWTWDVSGSGGGLARGIHVALEAATGL